jgi:hypothetical protein
VRICNRTQELYGDDDEVEVALYLSIMNMLSSSFESLDRTSRTGSIGTIDSNSLNYLTDTPFTSDDPDYISTDIDSTTEQGTDESGSSNETLMFEGPVYKSQMLLSSNPMKDDKKEKPRNYIIAVISISCGKLIWI